MTARRMYEPPSMERISPIPVEAAPTEPLDASRPLTVTATDVRAYLPFIGEPTCIYYSGSVALGWNHARSDLDIYVISALSVEPSGAAGQHWSIDIDADPPTVQFIQGALGPYRAHVMFWLESQVDAVIDRLPCADDLGSVYGLSNADWNFVYKLSIARAMEGESWLLAQQERVRRSGLSQGLSYWNVASAYSLLEDVEGFLISSDIESAVLSAQEAVRNTVDAILFQTGDITKLAKWRARRVRAVAPEILTFDEYWELETMARFDPANPRQWAERTARRCHDLLIEVTRKLDAGR